MSLQVHRGDLLAVSEGVLVHGCNAQGVMRSGVAKAIRRRWPAAFAAYRAAHRAPGGLVPGTVSFAQVGERLWIANAVTQHRYGYDGACYVDEDAVHVCFEQVARFCAAHGGLPVHFPRIGCGLGGGQWHRIAPRIVSAAAGCALHLWLPAPARSAR